MFSFYAHKHSGRTVIIHPQLGGAEVQAIFYNKKEKSESNNANQQETCSEKSNVQKYTLTVSTYQLCILLLFNKKEKFSYEVKKETFLYSDR